MFIVAEFSDKEVMNVNVYIGYVSLQQSNAINYFVHDP